MFPLFAIHPLITGLLLGLVEKHGETEGIKKAKEWIGAYVDKYRSSLPDEDLEYIGNFIKQDAKELKEIARPDNRRLAKTREDVDREEISLAEMWRLEQILGEYPLDEIINSANAPLLLDIIEKVDRHLAYQLFQLLESYEFMDFGRFSALYQNFLEKIMLRPELRLYVAKKLLAQRIKQGDIDITKHSKLKQLGVFEPGKLEEEYFQRLLAREFASYREGRKEKAGYCIDLDNKADWNSLIENFDSKFSALFNYFIFRNNGEIDGLTQFTLAILFAQFYVDNLDIEDSQKDKALNIIYRRSCIKEIPNPGLVEEIRSLDLDKRIARVIHFVQKIYLKREDEDSASLAKKKLLEFWESLGFKPIACKFPGETGLTSYERIEIEKFIRGRKRQVLDSKELSRHRLFKRVIEILDLRSPAFHAPIKDALIKGEAVTINSGDIFYKKYNCRQAYVRVCIVKSDNQMRKFFGRDRDKDRLGVPIYPAFEEEDGRLFLNLNILYTLLPSLTPKVLTGLIVHELSELLLGKEHIEAVLEEKHYDDSKIPTRLLWMIDELGRLSIKGDRHTAGLLRQLIKPYRLSGVYFGRVNFEVLRKVEELSRLVTQRAQMWLDFVSLIERSKKYHGDIRDRLVQFIVNYPNETGQEDINTFRGAVPVGKAKDFSFSIGDSRYTCNGFGQTNEMVIIGLIQNEKFGLCLWRFSTEKGTFKIYSLKDAVDKSEKLRKRFFMEAVGSESRNLENAFEVREETIKTATSPSTPKKVRDSQEIPEFIKLGELVIRYGEFLKNRKAKEPLPLTARTNTYGLPEEIQKTEPFSFEVPKGRKRRVASIYGSRFTLTIPKDIGGKATIGVYWHGKWGLWLWVSNIDGTFFAVYRADSCLECWSKEKRWKDIYSSPIARGKTLKAALKEAEIWLTKGIKEEKDREEAKEIVKKCAEISRINGDVAHLQARINEFKAAIFAVTSERLIVITPHAKNRLRFRRVGKPGEKYRMRFILHENKGLLAVFTSIGKRRRTVVYSLQAYSPSPIPLRPTPRVGAPGKRISERGKEVKFFDVYPIAEGRDYREVMRRALISEEDILDKLNKILNKCGYKNLDEFINNLSSGLNLAQINMLKAHLAGLEEILKEASYLGEESQLYITLRDLIETIRKLTSPAEMWKEQFDVSGGILALKTGTVIRYDVAERRSINFPEIDYAVKGPAAVEFILRNPLQLKGFGDKNLKLELLFREGNRQAKKLFYLHIARNFLYILGPDGKRFTLAQLEDENVQRGVISEISQAGPVGSISECLTDLFGRRETLKDRAITVKNTIQQIDVPGWRSGTLGETTIRWELNALAELGFLDRYTYAKEHQFYITRKLLAAAPEAIDKICRLPELVYPSKFPKDPRELQSLKSKIDYILLFQKLAAVRQYQDVSDMAWERDIYANNLSDFYQSLLNDPALSELHGEIDFIMMRLIFCIVISTLNIKGYDVLKPLWDMILSDEAGTEIFNSHTREFISAYGNDMRRILVLLEDMQFKVSQSSERLAELVKEIKEKFQQAEKIAQPYPDEDLPDHDALNYYARKKIEFLNKIKEGDTVIIIYHEDADGVSSAVLETLFLENYFKGSVKIQYVPVLYSSYSSLEEANISDDAHIIVLDFNYYTFKEIAGKSRLSLEGRNKLIIDHHDDRMEPIEPGQVGIPEKDGWLFVSPKRCLGIQRSFPAGNLARILNREVLLASCGKDTADYYSETYAWIAAIAVYGDMGQHENADLIGLIRKQGINPIHIQGFSHRLNMVSQAGLGGSNMALNNLLKIAKLQAKRERIIRGEPIDNLMPGEYREKAELLERHAEALKEHVLGQKMSGPLLFYHLTQENCRIEDREYRLAEIMADVLHRALPDRVVAVTKVIYGNKVKLELRARAHEGLDMGEIMAGLYKGGGHRKAGGAEIEIGAKDAEKTLRRIRQYLEQEIARQLHPTDSPDTERGPPEDDFIKETLEKISQSKPKVVVFYNKRYPLEPLGEVVERIREYYPPSQILFVEFPHSYRPLGYALNSFQYLYSAAQDMAGGAQILKDYTTQQNKKFGELLLAFIQEVKKRSQEMSRLHEQGFKTRQGKARKLIAGVLDEIISALTRTGDIEFDSMLKVLAKQNPALKGEEELVVKKLTERYPHLHFISLHGQFTNISVRVEHQRYYNDIWGTTRASQYHTPLTEQIMAFKDDNIPKWGYIRIPFSSGFLRSQIDPGHFDQNISYAFFELPIFPFPEDSLPIPEDELIMSVIGSYLMQDPYFATAKNESSMDMDYFRRIPLAPEARDAIAKDLKEYLDLFIHQIEEAPGVIEGELPRGIEISVEETIEMLRQLLEETTDLPLPYVIGFDEFGKDRLLEKREIEFLIRLLTEYLAAPLPNFRITPLKRRDGGLIIEKRLSEKISLGEYIYRWSGSNIKGKRALEIGPGVNTETIDFLMSKGANVFGVDSRIVMPGYANIVSRDDMLEYLKKAKKRREKFDIVYAKGVFEIGYVTEEGQKVHSPEEQRRKLIESLKILNESVLEDDGFIFIEVFWKRYKITEEELAEAGFRIIDSLDIEIDSETTHTILVLQKQPFAPSKTPAPEEETLPSPASIKDEQNLRQQFEDMLSSRERLEEYIETGRILELVPEWDDWNALYENVQYREYHPISPERHLLLAFKRLESAYFRDIIKKYNLTDKELKTLRRALFLHDFGEILVLREDPSYSKESQKIHPEKSARIARDILLRLGYSGDEIEKELILIEYHSVLKDMGQRGSSNICPIEFVRALRSKRNLKLLTLLQLIDAASVEERFENSLSIGLEKRINDIAGIIESILGAKSKRRLEKEQELLNYLNDIQRQDKEIEEAFKRFKRILKRENIMIDDNLLKEAFLAMHRSHMGQLRKDEYTPYVIHCVETAIILVKDLGIRDPDLIIAALLHDVLEDTRTTPDALGRRFGKKVVSMIKLLSKPDKKNYPTEEAMERDYLRRLIYGTNEITDREILTAVQTIKIADRIHSIRTLKTKDEEFPRKKINETYEIYIHHFIFETEVSVSIKRILIKELIKRGIEWDVLDPEQISMLRMLSKEIVSFRIPELKAMKHPFSFIKGLITHQKRPDRPLVLAFDGMSGVGKSSFTGNLRGFLEKTGRRVVVFDGNDYLLSRSERDGYLSEARQKRETFYEQKEKLYDFGRFKRDVLDRISEFRSSNESRIDFRLTNLYDRLTGELTEEKDYHIDRDTIIIVEGIHILQEEFLPLYDSTFFIFAPKEQCLKNVLLREREKPEECRQPGYKIMDRFNYLDWPSYRKHWIEYRLSGGFIIDDTDYKAPVLKRNPFPRYPDKAPWVPEELIKPEILIKQNLNKILSLLQEKGVNTEGIVQYATDPAGILRNLLSIEAIDKICPLTLPSPPKGERARVRGSIEIPLADAEPEELLLFLEQLSLLGEFEAANIFFRLFILYFLEEAPGIIPDESVSSLSIENPAHIKLFNDIFERIKNRRESLPLSSLSHWAKDIEIPVLLDIDSIIKDPKKILVIIKRLALNLKPNQHIDIILTHPDMPKAEVKRIFKQFYRDINLGSRKTKKEKIRVSFELNNLHTSRKGFSKYIRYRFRKQRKIRTGKLFLITTEPNLRDVYRRIRAGFVLEVPAFSSEGSISTFVPGALQLKDKGWGPLLEKDTIEEPEYTIETVEDGNKWRIKFPGFETPVEITGTEWIVYSDFPGENLSKALSAKMAQIDAINATLAERIKEHIDIEENHIDESYTFTDINLTIRMDKELLRVLFGGDTDMDIAQTEFLDRLTSALKMEQTNGSKIERLKGEEPMRFALVDRYSHHCGDSRKNRLVVLHRNLAELRKQDRAIFDAYIETLIAHELGLHETGQASSEEDEREKERKRVEIDAYNLYSSLIQKGKTYADAENVLKPFLPAYPEFFSMLKRMFEEDKTCFPVIRTNITIPKVSDLFSEVVRRNLKGREILQFCLGDNPVFKDILDSLNAILDSDPDRLTELESKGLLDKFIFIYARFFRHIGLPYPEYLQSIFPKYPNLARSLKDIYTGALDEDMQKKYELEMELVAAHAYRVARLFKLICKVLDKDTDNDLPSLDEGIGTITSLLHDVGKASVIDLISQPRKLTPDEFKKIDEHAHLSLEKLDDLLDQILGTKPFPGKKRVRLPKEVIQIIRAEAKFRETVEFHHQVGRITEDPYLRLLAETLMAADVFDALLDASRAYILQGGDIKAVSDALDILSYMRDRKTGSQIIRPDIIRAIKKLYEEENPEFMDTITQTHSFPAIYTAIVMSGLLKGGIAEDGANILETARNGTERARFEQILDAVGSSNLDIRTKIRFIRNIKQISDKISGFAVPGREITITQPLDLRNMLFINSELRLDLSKEALDKIVNGGIIILRGTWRDITDAYKILLARLEKAGKPEYRENIYAALIDEKSGEINIVPVYPRVEREELKRKIAALLIERQEKEKRGDILFRRQFEEETYDRVRQLHEMVPPPEILALTQSVMAIAEMPLSGLDLSRLYAVLRTITGLDLLDEIKECAIGSTDIHVALMPKALENMARGNFDFFKERFVGFTPETDACLGQMQQILEELAEDKEIFIAFIMAFLLHDYGLLPMRSGVNSHAADGEKLLDSLLAKLDLTDKQKEIIKALVAEHAKFPMMFSGHVTPFNYEYSLQRLEKQGISRETALKMYSLLLFLDTSSSDSQWIREKGWLNNAYVMGMLYFTSEQNLERFKENYHKRRLLLMAENYTAVIGGEKEIDRLFSPPFEIPKDPDVTEYINRIRFNLPEGGRDILKELSTREKGLDNPNILKFFCLLAQVYRKNGLDPDKIEVTFIAGKNPGDKLNSVLDGLTLAEAEYFPFDITINSEAIVINLKEEDSESFWRKAEEAEQKAVAEFLGRQETIYSLEDAVRLIKSADTLPGSYFVVKDPDMGEFLSFIRSIPGLETRIKDLGKYEPRFGHLLTKYFGENWRIEDVLAELTIYRIKGTDKWIIIKGEAFDTPHKPELDVLSDKGLLENFFHFHGLKKHRKMAYIPSAGDIENSFDTYAQLRMIGTEGIFVLDMRDFRDEDNNLYIPKRRSSKLKSLWNPIAGALSRTGKIDFERLSRFGIKAEFVEWEDLDEGIIAEGMSIKELIESESEILQIMGIKHIFKLLGNIAIPFISDFIRDKDTHFKITLFRLLTEDDSIDEDIINLLKAFCIDKDLLLKLNALRILLGMSVISETAARNILRQILKEKGPDSIIEILHQIGAGKLRTLIVELLKGTDSLRDSLVSLVAHAKQDEKNRDAVIEALRTCSDDNTQTGLTQSMAWHVLEAVARDDRYKGKIVYSLSALLKSSLNDGNTTQRLKNLIERTKGRVFFYTGNGCILDKPDYKYLKGSLITADRVRKLVGEGELVVFMVKEEHREQLGINKLNPGRLSGNQIVIPVEGERDVENDIFLGLEIIRNEGRTDELPSIFKLLLIETIINWLKANSQPPTAEKIQEILQIKMPEPYYYHLKDIEESHKYIKDLLTSV